MDRKIHREKPTNFNKESRILYYSSYPVHLLKRARLIIGLRGHYITQISQNTPTR